MNFFLSFFFYQSTLLSSRAVDGRRMYSGGSVVGKPSTIGIQLSPTPPLSFKGGVNKCEIWRRFQHNFEPPSFEYAARYPNSEIKVLV